MLITILKHGFKIVGIGPYSTSWITGDYYFRI